jgi:class 3 adenylate cyclase
LEIDVQKICLATACQQAGLPPAHVGVAAGPVVIQGGDYVGRTVNLAARIAAMPAPAGSL